MISGWWETLSQHGSVVEMKLRQHQPLITLHNEAGVHFAFVRKSKSTFLPRDTCFYIGMTLAYICHLCVTR